MMKPYSWSELILRYDERIFQSGVVISAFVGIVAFILRDLASFEVIKPVTISVRPQISWIIILVFGVTSAHKVVQIAIRNWLCPAMIIDHGDKARFVLSRAVLLIYPGALEDFKHELLAKVAGERLAARAVTSQNPVDRTVLSDLYASSIFMTLQTRSRIPSDDEGYTQFDPAGEWDAADDSRPGLRAALTWFYRFAFGVVFGVLYIWVPLRALAFFGVF